jgi:hypothetical protein
MRGILLEMASGSMMYISSFMNVRFEAFAAVTMKNVVYWDVALCRSCVNRRFGGTYRLHLQGRKIRELQVTADWATRIFPHPAYTHPSATCCWPSPQTPHLSPLCCIPMWHTVPLSLFLYSWLFLTDGSVCSHLLTLVHRSRIFLPWRWRRYVPPKRRLTQDLHSATSQKTTLFEFHEISRGVQATLRFCLSNLRGCNVDITGGRDLWIAPLR